MAYFNFIFQSYIYLYSIGPFAILILINALLAHHLLIVEKRAIVPETVVTNTKRKNFTLMTFAFSFAFVGFTAPYAILGRILIDILE